MSQKNIFYPWTSDIDFSHLRLRLYEVFFKVLDKEAYDDKDEPNKHGFQHPWRKWRGVTIRVKTHTKIISGYRGKTVWYFPDANSILDGKDLCFDLGYGIKIIKVPVEKSIDLEYRRLLYEVNIQKVLWLKGLAPEVKEIFLLKNRACNHLLWFDEMHTHLNDSIYFAILMKNVEHSEFPADEVDIDENFLFTGKMIDKIKVYLKKLGIQPHDLGLGNILYSLEGNPQIIDFHKWKWNFHINVPAFPKYLQIELNNTCNARCLICHIPKMKRQRGEMSNQLLDRILKEAAEFKLLNITPFLHGEPFMREDFIEILGKINQILPEASIAIFTNGSFLNKKKVEELKSIKNITRLNFSFQGGDESTFQMVTGLNFYSVSTNVEYALKNLPFKMIVTMALFDKNILSKNAFNQKWGEKFAKTYPAYNYLGKIPGTHAPLTFNYCDRIFRSMTVLWDGRVSLCCMDSEGEHILGDLKKSSLFEIWNGLEAKKYREMHMTGRSACYPCFNCNQELLVEEFPIFNKNTSYCGDFYDFG